MESMSPYARQFVEQLPRPAVDRLTGIPPTVAIEQRVSRGSRKSTVATITEVAPYLRLLYARLGVQHQNPDTDKPVTPLSPSGSSKNCSPASLASPPARRAKHSLSLRAPDPRTQGPSPAHRHLDRPARLRTHARRWPAPGGEKFSRNSTATRSTTSRSSWRT